jgi:hypothetical protein
VSIRLEKEGDNNKNLTEYDGGTDEKANETIFGRAMTGVSRSEPNFW